MAIVVSGAGQTPAKATRLLLFALAAASAIVVGIGSAATAGDPAPRIMFQPGSIGLFNRTSITVRGLAARSMEVHLRGATDAAGLAYEWTPYRWRRLRLSHGAWRGALAAPALPGIYQLQLRLDGGRKLVSSAGWLLRVFPQPALTRRSFPNAAAAVRGFIAHLPGDEVLVAIRRWPQAAFDHRDPRLNRLFVVAYAPRADERASSRLGLFVTTVRDGFHGRWRLLQATTQPYGP